MQTCARDVDVAVSTHATAATPQRSASSNDCTGAQCPQCASLSQPCGAQLAAANANACAESKDCPDRFFCAAEADGGDPELASMAHQVPAAEAQSGAAALVFQRIFSGALFLTSAPFLPPPCPPSSPFFRHVHSFFVCLVSVGPGCRRGLRRGPRSREPGRQGPCATN